MLFRSSRRPAQLGGDLLLGWSAEKIATKLGRTPRAIRYAISQPAFQSMFAAYQREQYQRIDHRMRALLETAVDTLHGLLRHRDWRARDAAVEKILKVHGRLLETIAGRVEHHHHTGSAPELVMSDETRAQLREALTLWRQQSPRTLPSLVTRNGIRGDEASAPD